MLNLDADLARAFTLADGMWWLPTAEAQMTTIWTAIEMLMRPGRKDTTKKLGGAVRAYVGFDRSSGDRLYRDVTRLYFERGNSVHAGAEPMRQERPGLGMKICASFFSVRFRSGSGHPDPKTLSRCGVDRS